MCLQFILFYLHVPFEVAAARIRCECVQYCRVCVCVHVSVCTVCVVVCGHRASKPVVPMLHDLGNVCLHASLFGLTRLV